MLDPQRKSSHVTPTSPREAPCRQFYRLAERGVSGTGPGPQVEALSHHGEEMLPAVPPRCRRRAVHVRPLDISSCSGGTSACGGLSSCAGGLFFGDSPSRNRSYGVRGFCGRVAFVRGEERGVGRTGGRDTERERKGEKHGWMGRQARRLMDIRRRLWQGQHMPPSPTPSAPRTPPQDWLCRWQDGKNPAAKASIRRVAAAWADRGRTHGEGADREGVHGRGREH